jgi:ATP-dependent RNA helicase DeaD
MSETTFRDLGLSEATLLAIQEIGFTTPTPIQIGAIPVLVAGKDAILRAQTGTGKTAAFGIPMIEQIEPPADGVLGLVLAPTRELAQQVARQIDLLGSRRGIKTAAVYGGSSFEEQLALVADANIVIATPGRLLDVVKRKRLSLAKVRFFGLDEADEMLSLGFEKDVREIARMLPKNRQTFLCSATIAEDVKRLSADLLNNPEEVDCSSDEVGARSVKHVAFSTPMGTKLEAFFRVLATESIDGAIVFANTRAATFRIHEALLAEGFNAGVLNGDLSQDERERALARMRGDSIQFLVATDVAARGIDISGLPAVINYDLPESAEVYIHRTGRTGRAGQFGVAYSLLTAADVTCHQALRKFFGIPMEIRSLPSSTTVAEARADRAIGQLVHHIDASEELIYGDFLPLARRILAREDGGRTIAKFLAFAAHIDTAQHAAAGFEAPAPTEAAAPAPAPAPAPAAAEAQPPRPPREQREPRGERPPRREERPAQPAPQQPAPAPQQPVAKTEDAQDAEDRRPDDAPAAGSTGGDATAEAVFQWLSNVHKSRRRGRWRMDESIAQTFQIEVERAVELAESHSGIEKSHGPRRMYRALVQGDGAPRAVEASQPPQQPARPPQQPSKPADRGPRPERTQERNQEPRPPKAAAPAPAPQADRAPRPDARPERKPRPDRDRRDRGGRAGRGNTAPALPMPEPEPIKLVTLRVNMGLDQFASPDILAAKLAVLTGFDAEDFDGVTLAPTAATLRVRADLAKDVVAAVQNEEVGGRPFAVTLAPRGGKK